MLSYIITSESVVAIRLDAATWSRIKTTARLASSEDVAAVYRRNHATEVAHLSQEDLIAAIVGAQLRADVFGITSGQLRARFTMLDVFRAPGFWAAPLIHQVLTSKGGTGDVRFGDACMLLKLAAVRTGQPHMVWW
jgi:hypothetical protein